MGPARSESSIMCWSIRARGLSTANVFASMLVSLHSQKPKVHQRGKQTLLQTCPKFTPSSSSNGGSPS
jgi:hypothetical protein